MSDFVPNGHRFPVTFLISFKESASGVKKFMEMMLKVEQHTVIGSVALKTVVSMLMMKEGQKTSKAGNWGNCSMKIRATRRNSLPPY